MSVEAKHIATFLLGAAAGIALHKYSTMSDEEKEAMAESIKSKAQEVKQKAEESFEKLKDYFEELRAKGSDALKEHLSSTEQAIDDLFNKKTTSI